MRSFLLGEWLVGVDELGDQGAVVEEVAVAEKLALHTDPRLAPQPFCLERITKQALDCAAGALEVVRVLYEQAGLAVDDLVDDPSTARSRRRGGSSTSPRPR
jgi:hypothetical protein